MQTQPQRWKSICLEQRIPVNKLQQSSIAATDELQTSQQEDQPLDDNINNDTTNNNDKQDSETINNLPELPQLSIDN